MVERECDVAGRDMSWVKNAGDARCCRARRGGVNAARMDSMRGRTRCVVARTHTHTQNTCLLTASGSAQTNRMTLFGSRAPFLPWRILCLPSYMCSQPLPNLAGCRSCGLVAYASAQHGYLDLG